MLLTDSGAHSYIGAESDGRIQLAKEIATEEFTSLNDWIKRN
ncbi:MAG: hypothetical protein AB7H80_14920 [Candidatus Kapaibacterium sp.]